MKCLNTIALFCTLGLSQAAFADLPMISNLQVMAHPPGASVTAGYLTINNISDEPLVVTGASSDAVTRIEMHESAIKNDVASMIKHEKLSIAAGETMELKHGGFHLMLMDLVSPLMLGSTLAVTLHTNQGDIQLSMPVVKPGMSAMPSAKHGHGEINIGTPEPSDKP
ncbi:MAG: copper chaperone PCu(A)C [Granulosicoccaceae bacterium]